MEYYVYCLIDPVNDKIFYVGKGCKKRMYEHVRNVKRGRIPNRSNIHLEKKIKKILSLGLKVKYKKVFVSEIEKDVYEKEREVIHEIGLSNLCNLTEGGDGYCGVRFSEEHKMKISKALSGRFLSDEHKRKLSESLKGNTNSKGHKQTEEHKSKLSKVRSGRIVTNETKQKISDNNARFWKGKTFSDAHRKKLSDARKRKNI